MYSPYLDGFKVVGLGTCNRIVPDWQAYSRTGRITAVKKWISCCGGTTVLLSSVVLGSRDFYLL